ncbi:putative protease [Desulfobotulus alkaliphilus]|uniref:Putative protease n=1 Tax=Desulfobotulus alkaliphilus TaxID=622671 RepID=A0A562RRE8_9BACT|nr:U32 family peptidase [Desulfobotulus alkaliphilus]TWI71608.1 putative protease [Desulfobotulus alkaliphilus]
MSKHTHRSKLPVELLAPAGNMEKLEIALAYGADAVYLGGQNFSLRNFSDNFSIPEIKEAVRLAHHLNAKVYVTCNIFPRSHELSELKAYLRDLSSCGPDALIVADPGVLLLARETVPHIPLHLSTQANTTNVAALKFWAKQGIRRINGARELSMEEIKALCQENIEVECFIHGAMCIAYSGRCLLSSCMADRDSNRGHCAHPCRWSYSVVEAKRPGHYFPLLEDQRGSYIFNSKDLCMIAHLPEMIAAGVSSFKIEGRMKSIHYLAVTTGVYREALDLFFKNPAAYKEDPSWFRRLNSLHHRGYGTGFYLNKPQDIQPDVHNTEGKSPKALFVGKILSDGQSGSHALVCRNRFVTGDVVEVLHPGAPPSTDRIVCIKEADTPVSVARPNTRLQVTLENDHRALSLIRIPEEPLPNASAY